MSSTFSDILPLSGTKMPDMICNSVLRPEPLSPVITTNSPELILSDKSSKINFLLSGKTKLMLLSSIPAPVIPDSAILEPPSSSRSSKDVRGRPGFLIIPANLSRRMESCWNFVQIPPKRCSGAKERIPNKIQAANSPFVIRSLITRNAPNAVTKMVITGENTLPIPADISVK